MVKIKKVNILEVFLLLAPIIDIATSIIQRKFDFNISLGIIIRAVFLVFLVIYIFRFKKKSRIIYILTFAIYAVVYMFNTYIIKGQSYLFFELKELIKAYYFPLCIVGLLNYIEIKKYYIKPKIFFIIILEYITLLFIPFIFNIDFESYAQDKVGTIGWFFSGNEISAIYAILFVFIIFSYEYIENKTLYLAVAFFSIYTVMQIGTKIPAIAVLVVLFVFVLIKIIQKIINKKIIDIKFIAISSLLLLFYGFVFIISPVYQNYYIYKNYLINTRLVTSQMKENGEIQEQRLTSQEFATIIHSGRMETKNKISEKLKNTTLMEKIFGMGKLDIKDNTQNLCEIDYYDILFNFGYIGFILYFIPIIAVIIVLIKKINIKRFICSDIICCYIISLVIAFLLCAIAGHTFVAPSVSIFIALMIVQFAVEKELYEDNNTSSSFGLWWN